MTLGARQPGLLDLSRKRPEDPDRGPANTQDGGSRLRPERDPSPSALAPTLAFVEQSPRRGRLDLRDVVAAPAAWPTRLQRAALHFGYLCAGIILVMLIPWRVEGNDDWIVALAAAGLVCGTAVFWLGARALAERGRSHVGTAAARLVLQGVRRLGLSLLGLAFFTFWAIVYVSLWLFHPTEAFNGLSQDPRLSDFFYYAVSTALTSPPEGIGAGSRGVRAATVIEMLMGFVLVAGYLASFLNWDDVAGAPASDPQDASRSASAPDRSSAESSS